MVMDWACSSFRASMRRAYSKGMPWAAQRARMPSSLPLGRELVSASRRPMTVLLPWSTWPTKTTFICSLLKSRIFSILHIPFFAQGFEAATVFFVLGAAGALGDVGEFADFEFGDDFGYGTGFGFDGEGAGVAAEGAVALAVALVVVEGYGGDVFFFDVFPDVEFGPVEQGVDADVGAGGEVGFVLVPEFGGLVGDVPFVLAVAGGEVAFFAAGAFFIGTGADDDAGEGLGIFFFFVLVAFVVEAQTAAFAVEGLAQGFGFEEATAGDAVDRAIGEGAFGCEGFEVGTDDHGEVHFANELVAVLDHLGDFEVGVDVDEGEGDVAEEGFAGEPEQDGGVFAHGPEHAEAFEVGVGLAQDVYGD